MTDEGSLPASRSVEAVEKRLRRALWESWVEAAALVPSWRRGSAVRAHGLCSGGFSPSTASCGAACGSALVWKLRGLFVWGSLCAHCLGRCRSASGTCDELSWLGLPYSRPRSRQFNHPAVVKLSARSGRCSVICPSTAAALLLAVGPSLLWG